jgi:hydrogenase maturation factor HypF (carbamoyltransferase family)
VYSLACGLGLGGLVGNDMDVVFAEVEGPPEAVAEFMLALRRDSPPLAPTAPSGVGEFLIAGRRGRDDLASVVAMARRGRASAGVALSGGVAQNQRLLRTLTGLLEARGFDVLTQSQVPCNDGGISLGWAVVAAARTASNNSYGARTFI